MKHFETQDKWKRSKQFNEILCRFNASLCGNLCYYCYSLELGLCSGFFFDDSSVGWEIYRSYIVIDLMSRPKEEKSGNEGKLWV